MKRSKVKEENYRNPGKEQRTQKGRFNLISHTTRIHSIRSSVSSSSSSSSSHCSDSEFNHCHGYLMEWQKKKQLHPKSTTSTPTSPLLLPSPIPPPPPSAATAGLLPPFHNHLRPTQQQLCRSASLGSTTTAATAADPFHFLLLPQPECLSQLRQLRAQSPSLPTFLPPST